MPIDASIYGAIQQQKQSNPLEQYAQMQQIEHAQGQNRLADLMFGEKQRETQDEAQLRDLTRQAGGDQSKLRDLVYGAGNYKQGMAIDKSIAEQKKAKADVNKTSIETLQKVTGMMGSTAYALAQSPTLNMQEVMGAVERLKSQLPAEYHSALDLSKLPQDPQGLRQALQGIYTQSVETDKLLTDATSRRNNDQTNQTSRDNNKLTNDTSRANNTATVGASYDNANATREVAKATRDSANIQRDQATEMKLADDYRAQSKDFKAVGDAYRQINATLDKAVSSPAATLAAATKFMKLLDPGSVVRESELGMALAATGAFDRATNYMNTLQYGKVLTAKQTADFKNITEQIYGAAQAGQKQVDSSYKQTASAYKLRPEMVLQDLGQNDLPRNKNSATKSGVTVGNW